MRINRRALLGCSVALPLIARAGWAQAATGLEGRSIRIVTTGTPGGASDTLARIFADSLAEKVPGVSCTVVNMRSKGNVVALKEVYESGERDIVLSVISAGVIFQQISKGGELPFDLARMPAIGSFTSSYFALGLGKDVAWDFSKARGTQPQLKIGVHYRSASDFFFAALLNQVTNLNIKIAEGFETDVMQTMFLAGDFNAIVFSAVGSELDTVKSGDLKPALLIGTGSYASVVASAPRLPEVVTPDADPEIVSTMQQITDCGRVLLAAPSTPPEVVDALRAAFDAVVKSESYAAKTATLGEGLDPKNGAEVSALFGRLFAAGSPLQAKLKAAVECGRLAGEGGGGNCTVP